MLNAANAEVSQFPSPNPKSCFAGVVKKSFNAIGIAVNRPISFSEEYDSEVINSKIFSKVRLLFSPKRIGKMEAISEAISINESKRRNFFQENFVKSEDNNKITTRMTKKNFNSAKVASSNANPHFKKQESEDSFLCIKQSKDLEAIIEKKISI